MRGEVEGFIHPLTVGFSENTKSTEKMQAIRSEIKGAKIEAPATRSIVREKLGPNIHKDTKMSAFLKN